MLNEKIEKALNEQINAEMWSAYLYLSMAAFCHKNGQPGMAKWFEVQFQEEQDHAKILFNYIVQRNGAVTRTEGDKPHKQPLRPDPRSERLCHTEHAQMVHRRTSGGRGERTEHHRQPEDDKGQRIRHLHARQRAWCTHLHTGRTTRSSSAVKKGCCHNAPD